MMKLDLQPKQPQSASNPEQVLTEPELRSIASGTRPDEGSSFNRNETMIDKELSPITTVTDLISHPPAMVELSEGELVAVVGGKYAISWSSMHLT